MLFCPSWAGFFLGREALLTRLGDAGIEFQRFGSAKLQDVSSSFVSGCEWLKTIFGQSKLILGSEFCSLRTWLEPFVKVSVNHINRGPEFLYAASLF